MASFSGVAKAQLPDLYRSVDKYDKIGVDGVREELIERSIAADAVARMIDLLQAQKPGIDSLDLMSNAIGEEDNGIRELRQLAEYLRDADVPADCFDFDFTMVRGLGYYTGPIFETVISVPNLGSISGGGRYDELVGMFRKQSLPTTGTSFGIERIIDLMDVLNLYPAKIGGTLVQVLVTVFNAETRRESIKIANQLRKAGINTEVYLESRKLGRQFSYADKKGIPVVAVARPDETDAGVVKLRRLRDGEEVTAKVSAAAAVVSELL